MNNRVVSVVRSHIRRIAYGGIGLYVRVCSENEYKHSIELKIATEKQQQLPATTEWLHTHSKKKTKQDNRL